VGVVKRYLSDPGFWLAVMVVSLVCAPFVGFGRALAEAVLS